MLILYDEKKIENITAFKINSLVIRLMDNSEKIFIMTKFCPIYFKEEENEEEKEEKEEKEEPDEIITLDEINP